MIVVIPFHKKDQHLVNKTLSWCAELDGIQDYSVLLFPEIGLELEETIVLAKKAFKRVYYQLYPKPPIAKWPQAPNWVFQHVLRAVSRNFKNQAFLLLEPDAVPIRSGWLSDIAAEYLKCGRPVMGHIVEGIGHCNGVAVYPPNFEVLCPDVMRCSHLPWDVVMKQRTITRTHRANHLIQRVWNLGEEGPTNRPDAKPPHFETKDDVKRLVDMKAAIFHRCKDGSLVDVLRQKDPLWKKLNPFANRRAGTALVMLGRYGDITNVLPIAKKLHDEGNTPHFVVAAEYKDILDGVSYVKPEVLKVKFHDLPNGVNQAKKKFVDVRVAQVYGSEYQLPIRTGSFNEEQYRMAGCHELFGKLPLVFDRRDYRREALLAKKYWTEDKPLLLVNVLGNSSPFKHGHQLLHKLRLEWQNKFQIVDLGQIRAERVYDLLGLMDRAAGLITIDTSTLHLANASSVPVIALLVDSKTPWHATNPLGNVVLKLKYKEVLPRISDIHTAIAKLPVHNYHLIHTFPGHAGNNPESRQRIGFARENNRLLYRQGGWLPVAQQDSMLRILVDQKGQLPYAKSLIDNAFELGRENDMVVLTNTDINFSPDASSQLREKLTKYRASFAYRRDFQQPFTKQLSAEEVKKGNLYPGSDMFALTRSWWVENRDRFPDMVLGRECWDWCLRELIISTEGKEAGFNDLIYHQRHASAWEMGDNKKTLSGNIHNQQLAKVFLTGLGIDLAELKGRV